MSSTSPAAVSRTTRKGVAKALLHDVQVLPDGGGREIQQRAGPDNRHGADGLRTSVLELRGERARHLAAIFVSELRGIAPEQRTVEVVGTHGGALFPRTSGG